MPSDNQEHWQEFGEEYRKLIEDPDRDSVYLRRNGLIPTVRELVGPPQGLRILDAGCGPGWLVEELPGADLHLCDADPNVAANEHPNFSVQDIRELSYEDESFDVVVVNFVLMWLPELDQACRELHRVTRLGGRLVLSMLHPYFYRAGGAQDSGDYLIDRDLAEERAMPGHKIAGRVGPLVYYYRRFDTYVNTVLRAGWTIRGFRDWYIDMKHYAVQGSMKSDVRRTGKVPLYCFLEGSRS